MSRVAVDFGTCNTVLARFNETTERAETLEAPGVSLELRYRLPDGAAEERVWLTPSVIHYGEEETLIGAQVVERGLLEHKHTFRWMKRAVSQGITKRKKTPQGHISPEQAGSDFLTRLLNYVSDRVDFAEDEFTFTAPVERFETFQDWLWRIAESLGIQRVRLLDEPTACVLGYEGAARRDDRFLVFDFGGGTLDVLAVRLDLGAAGERKAVQLGQAGVELGGMDLDRWLAEDFAARHGFDGPATRELEPLILREAEQVKIALSDPDAQQAPLAILNFLAAPPAPARTAYAKTCPKCQSGAASHQSCLGCLLLAHEFEQQIAETLDRALENAAMKAGLRSEDLTRVAATGGTSLTPAAHRALRARFGGKLAFERPFDAVVRGACRGEVVPILQHDYAIESYSSAQKAYEFKPLFEMGTEYPTATSKKLWARGYHDGMTRIGIRIFEVSRMPRREEGASIVGEDGAFRDVAQTASDYKYICLNPDAPTFIHADPPIDLARDEKRFLCAFRVDGNRRLLVTVSDRLSGEGRTLLSDHPVVRL